MFMSCAGTPEISGESEENGVRLVGRLVKQLHCFINMEASDALEQGHKNISPQKPEVAWVFMCVRKRNAAPGFPGPQKTLWTQFR